MDGMKLPGTFLYVYLGHIAGAAVGADRSRTAAEWAMLAVGLLATVVVTVYVTRLARRKLQEQMNEAVEEEASLVPEEAVQRAPGGGTRLRGTVMLAAAALIMAAAAVALAANATAFERWLTGLFGPPRVELKEAYGAAGAESNASEASFDHSALDALLRQYVDADGWVDYAGLQADQARLDAYLAAVADAPFDALGRDEKLALLINAYNAFTLKLLVEHLPIGSIMYIPAAERWDAERWNVGGNVWSCRSTPPISTCPRRSAAGESVRGKSHLKSHRQHPPHQEAEDMIYALLGSGRHSESGRNRTRPRLQFSAEKGSASCGRKPHTDAWLHRTTLRAAPCQRPVITSVWTETMLVIGV